jgi:hypothetical protein
MVKSHQISAVSPQQPSKISHPGCPPGRGHQEILEDIHIASSLAQTAREVYLRGSSWEKTMGIREISDV